MKHILLLSLLFVIIGCSSKEEKITSGMKPFMAENFPDASFEIVIKDNLYQLVINDGGNLMNKENYEPIVNRLFSAFYKVFLTFTDGSEADSKFEVLYENDTLTWKSDTFKLSDLSDVYNLNR